jgi:acyl-CoA thioester hydrolase
MTNEAGLLTYGDVVRPEWVDYNGHMRDAFYLLVFSLAGDVLLDTIGLDDAQRRARRRSVYTLEAHINYLSEIKEGARMQVNVRVLAHDAKRLHIYLEMLSDGRAAPVAACEQMLLHVDTEGPRAAPFDPDVLERVRELARAHGVLPPPRYVGRSIGLHSH